MFKRSIAVPVLAFMFAVSLASTSQASVILLENFDNIATLPGAGWVQTNNSSPIGVTSWFQGNPGVFNAQAGANNAYIGANFDNAAPGGDISNWLITPTLSLDEFILSFYTRTEAGSAFPDRLEVRLSTSGASTNLADFTTLLTTINPGLNVGGYPEGWTPFTVALDLPTATSGRFAFRYQVTDTNTNGDYIGIDTVSVQAVPEPVTLVTMGLGLAAVRLRRKR